MLNYIRNSVIKDVRTITFMFSVIFYSFKLILMKCNIFIILLSKLFLLSKSYNNRIN